MAVRATALCPLLSPGEHRPGLAALFPPGRSPEGEELSSLPGGDTLGLVARKWEKGKAVSSVGLPKLPFVSGVGIQRARPDSPWGRPRGPGSAGLLPGP